MVRLVALSMQRLYLPPSVQVLLLRATLKVPAPKVMLDELATIAPPAMLKVPEPKVSWAELLTNGDSAA